MDLQNFLDPYSFATVMNDRNPQSTISKVIENVKARFKKDGGKPKENTMLATLKLSMAPFSQYFDLVKDFILLAQLILSQGGFYALLENPTDFFPIITLTLFIITITPHILSSIRLLLTVPELLVGKGEKLWQKFLLVFIVPLQPLFLLIRVKISLDKRKFWSLETLKERLPEYEKLKYHSTKFIKSILGLETTFQLIILFILQFYADSQTRTSQGLEQLFEQEAILFIDPRTFLIITTIWTVISATKSYISSSSARDYFPMKSKIILALFSLCSLTMRVSAIILYFTPSLGLFNVLRHLQGEMLPHQVPISLPSSLWNMLDTFWYGNAPPISWKEVSRHNYTGDFKSTPPPVSCYTFFTKEQYFLYFWALLAFQSILTLVLKRIINPESFQRQHWLDKIMHALENSHVPFPMEDWDQLSGSVQDHHERASKVMNEMFAVIVTNAFTNSILLSPLVILGKICNW